MPTDSRAEAIATEPDHRDTADDESGLTYPFDTVPEAGEALEVADGVLWVRMPLPWALNHINLYVLADGDGWTVVDTGVRSDKAKKRWEEIFSGAMGGRPVTRVIATHHHPDHLGLAGWFAGRFGIAVTTTRVAFLLARTLMLDVREAPPEEVVAFFRSAGLSAEMIGNLKKAGWGNFAKGVEALPVGFSRIAEGDVLKIGGADWHVIESAGHAPGHASLYCPARKLLLSGDQVLPKISSNVSVYPTEPDADPLAEWLESLARFKALPGDALVLPSHNAPFYGLHERLDQLMAKHVDRLADVAAMCAKPKASTEIFSALFRRRVTGMEYMMATGEAVAHLHFLARRGALARRVDADGVARFEKIADYDPEALRAELAAVTEKTKQEASWAV